MSPEHNDRGLAVITGGTKGIGLSTAREFAALGHPLLLAYRRDEEAARRAVADLEAQGADITLVQSDLSAGAGDIVDAATRDGRSVDILVANAAASAFKPLLDMREHHFEKTFGLTVGSFLELVRGLADRFRDGTSIVTVSGGDSIRLIPGHGLLGAAKAALETLTRYLAVELAPRGVRANCVLPGPVETDSARIWAREEWEPFVQRANAATPAGRLAKPEDIAGVIRLLCDPAAAWINGQVIVADGGMFFADRIFSGD